MGDWAKPSVETSLSNLSLSELSQDTVAVSARRKHSQALSEPMVTPVYRASIYRFNSVEHYEECVRKGGHFYARFGNPTKESLECTINALEGGAGSLVFSSGTAAISVVLMTFLRPGDHVVMPNPSYSGTVDFAENYVKQFGIEVSWVKGGCPVEDYRKAIKANTKMIYGETPCNPSIDILDLEEFGKLGQSHKGILTAIDSTFASPYLQQPIKYGIDIVIHSCSKYMGGHSDIIGGCATLRTVDLWQKLYTSRGAFGSIMPPEDASLLHRGVKTLPLRMERHSSNAQAVAEFLEKHPKVASVRYPGLKSHPGHEIAKKQMKSFSGMIMLKLKGGSEAGRALVNVRCDRLVKMFEEEENNRLSTPIVFSNSQNVKLIQLAESLGGVESVIEQPASMTHGDIFMTKEARLAGGITDDLIRLSVGVENIKDLIADLDQALQKTP